MNKLVESPSGNSMNVLNKVCFTICLICIIFGMLTTLLMVWTPGIDVVKWRLLTTNGVIFFAALATMTIVRVYRGKRAE